MNNFLKYIIYFLLGLIIYFLLRNKLVEGLNDESQNKIVINFFKTEDVGYNNSMLYYNLIESVFRKNINRGDTTNNILLIKKRFNKIDENDPDSENLFPNPYPDISGDNLRTLLYNHDSLGNFFVNAVESDTINSYYYHGKINGYDIFLFVVNNENPSDSGLYLVFYNKDYQVICPQRGARNPNCLSVDRTQRSRNNNQENLYNKKAIHFKIAELSDLSGNDSKDIPETRFNLITRIRGNEYIGFIMNTTYMQGFIPSKTSDYSIPLFSRIMGTNENGDYRSKYMGCQKYECDNIPKYTYEELNSKTLSNLKEILSTKISETNLDQEDINAMNKEKSIIEILKIDRANKYIDKENYEEINYSTCNNEMDYSSTSSLGDEANKCNHDICCFNTKCSSNDVENLRKSCGNGRILKKNAHCVDKKRCNNEYVSYCCTKHIGIINSDIKDLFVNIYNNNKEDDSLITISNLSDNLLDPYKISGQEISDYFNSISSTISEDNINNFLSTHNFDTRGLDTKLYNIFDFDDLINE